MGPVKSAIIWHMFPGLDLYCAGPAQPLTTAGEELDYLDHDLSGLSVRAVDVFEVQRKGMYDTCASMTMTHDDDADTCNRLARSSYKFDTTTALVGFFLKSLPGTIKGLSLSLTCLFYEVMRTLSLIHI